MKWKTLWTQREKSLWGSQTQEINSIMKNSKLQNVHTHKTFALVTLLNYNK